MFPCRTSPPPCNRSLIDRVTCHHPSPNLTYGDEYHTGRRQLRGVGRAAFAVVLMAFLPQNAHRFSCHRGYTIVLAVPLNGIKPRWPLAVLDLVWGSYEHGGGLSWRGPLPGYEKQRGAGAGRPPTSFGRAGIRPCRGEAAASSGAGGDDPAVAPDRAAGLR